MTGSFDLNRRNIKKSKITNVLTTAAEPNLHCYPSLDLLIMFQDFFRIYLVAPANLERTVVL